MQSLKNSQFHQKTKLILVIFLLTLLNLTLDVNKSYSAVAVVDNPTANLLLKKIDGNIMSEIAKITTQVAVLESQLKEAKYMAQALADGEITTEMVDFAFDQAEKCGFKPPSLPFPDFPELALPKLCDGKNDIETMKKNIAKLFSTKEGMNASQREKVNANIRKATKDSIEYSLALGTASRTLDASKKKEDWTEQMKQSQSLAHQMHMNNAILISIYDELIEIRRMQGAMAELQGFINSDDNSQYYNDKGELIK